MIKKLYLLIVLLILIFPGFAKKVSTLTEVSRPQDLIVDNQRVYVIEGTTIFIYSLKDYQLLTKFGKKGEGPQEFRVRPNGRVKIYPLDDYIYVNSIGKASIFTKKGKFVKEVKGVTGTNFMPLGHHQFIGEGIITKDNKNYRTIDIFDENLKKVNTVFQQEHINQGAAIRVYFSSIAFNTYDEKIFITGYEGFVMEVFDKKGEKLFTINRDFQERKITEQDKKNVLSWFKSDPRYDERAYQYIKEHIQFPEYYPAIDEVVIKDDKIYVRTHHVKGDDYEFVIFDINGKYLRTQFIHLVRDNPVYPYHYDIANGNVYQIIENLDEGDWELHIKTIE